MVYYLVITIRILSRCFEHTYPINILINNRKTIEKTTKRIHKEYRKDTAGIWNEY
jgi:hypothetical protein